jgi:hypothetical protein
MIQWTYLLFLLKHNGFGRSSSLDLLTAMSVALVRKMAGIGLRILTPH